MNVRNASASAFGWDFQINAAILLMLENIKDAKRVRVEGAYEDIEITLHDRTKIYAQVKAIEKPDNTSHVIDKLVKALGTLSDAAKKGDVSVFSYISNSLNPFNDKRTIGYFTGRTHLDFFELPDIAQKKINDIVQKNGYSDIDVHKLDIRIIPFYGNDLKNRYKEILACINEFLAEMNVIDPGIGPEIMGIWQRDFFQNATQSNTSIDLSKDKMIWPLIVMVLERTAANDYKKEFNDDEIHEVESKYKMIINQKTMSYNIISRILSDYRKSNKTHKQFVANHWSDYLDIASTIDADDATRESLVKIILYRIITKRQYIRDIKKGANL